MSEPGPSPSLQLSPSELIELCAEDGVLFSQAFFPRTVRQRSPEFHRRIWELLESPARYVAIEVFRGGAKTTLCRLFTLKRLCYGLSRTVLYVGKSAAHAARSVEWIMRQVEFNPLLAQTFGLRKGSKWTGEEIAVELGAFGGQARVLALGITGSVRGINVEDYRPDLIVGDDLVDEENSATPEQRQKLEDLWFGALKESLAPRSENPLAKMVLLGTPLDRADLNELCQRDPEWRSLRVGVFDEQGRSVWPDRWTAEELIAEKQAALARNQLSLWMREKECKIIDRELSDFRAEWLQYWEVLPERMQVFMAIDPVPPASEAQLRKNLRDKDYECLAVVGRYRGQVYLLEYSVSRGHTPEWTVQEFFRLLDKWRPRKVRVEGVAYQATLKWLLEQAMHQRRRYVQIESFVDRRSKRDRIVQALHGITSNKQFFCRREHTEFIEQFTAYPAVNHDDVLEAVAVATNAALEDSVLDAEWLEVEEDNIPELDLSSWRAAP